MSEMTSRELPERRREGGVELLRVVCMLLILAHHMTYHGRTMDPPLYGNRVLSAFLFVGGMTGVNSFVLITGYFLAPFRTRRLVATLLQTMFYSLGLTLLAQLAGWNTLSAAAYGDAALVVSRSPYWFVAMYLGLTAMLPLLQPAVKNLSRNAHLWIVILGGLYLSVIPTVTFLRSSSQFFHQITWFVYLYVLGAYFRKFPSRATRCLPLQAAIFLSMLVFMALVSLWGGEHPELFEHVYSRNNFIAEKNMLPQLLCSCGLFLFFAGLRVKPPRSLTLIASASFGVYLIHDHSLIRYKLWLEWLKVNMASQTERFWMMALILPPALYLVCAAVDLLRKYLLEKPLMKRLNPAFERLDRWLER